MESKKDADADSAQRQSPNQEIANNTNRRNQAGKTDSGSDTTERAGADTKDTKK